MTWVPLSGPSAGGQTTLPLESMIWSITRRGMRTPPLAIVLYAPSRSIGWTSSVPMPIDRTGAAVLG